MVINGSETGGGDQAATRSETCHRSRRDKFARGRISLLTLWFLSLQRSRKFPIPKSRWYDPGLLVSWDELWRECAWLNSNGQICPLLASHSFHMMLGLDTLYPALLGLDTPYPALTNNLYPALTDNPALAKWSAMHSHCAGCQPAAK